MGITGAIVSVLGNYARFGGRAGRAEFWWWWLTLIVVGALFAFAALQWGSGGAGTLIRWTYAAFGLAVLVPTAAVAVRRLHDTDRAGWWLLLYLVPVIGPIVMLILCALPGTSGPNRYGSRAAH